MLTSNRIQIRVTQQCIKHVLRERWYAWEDARKLWDDGYRPQLEEDSYEDIFEESTQSKA